MIIFLYGQDTYRAQAKLKEIIKSYEKANQEGLNLKILEGESLTFEKLQEELRGRSIFKEKKLVVIRNFFSNSRLKEKLLENADIITSSKDIIVFCGFGETSQRDATFLFLKKNAKIQEFALLEGQKLKNWIKKEAAARQCQLSDAATMKLIEFIGNDTWRAINEITKLACYKSSARIEPEDIGLLVEPNLEANIFAAIDALAAKNKKKALHLIHTLLGKGDSPLYILSMINFQFRNLLMIKDLIERGKPYYTLAKLTSLHPFVIKKSYAQAEKFTVSDLKKIYQKIFRIDINIKKGRIEPQTGLDLLIAEI